MVITLVGLVCILGLVMYLAAAPPKLQEIGRIMFWVGLLVLLLNGDKIVALIKDR